MPVYKSKRITKDGRCYFFKVSYKDIYGNSKTYISKSFKTKKEAELEEANFKINIGKLASKSSITFKEAYDEWYQHHKNTVKIQTLPKYNNYFKHLEPIFNTKLDEFNLSRYNL